MTTEITKASLAPLSNDRLPSALPKLRLESPEYWKQFPDSFWELVSKYYGFGCAISRGVSDLAVVIDKIEDLSEPDQVLKDIDRVAKEILVRSELYVLAVDNNDVENGNMETQLSAWVDACHELNTLASHSSVPSEIQNAVKSCCDQVLRGQNSHDHNAQDFKYAFCTTPESARANLTVAVRAMFHLLNCTSRV